MENIETPIGPGTGLPKRSFVPIAVVIVSLIAIACTFAVANSSLDQTIKLGGFIGIVATFLAACGWVHFSAARAFAAKADADLNNKADEGLNSLEEAGEFFAGALKPADTFRLIASRVRDIIPASNIVLYLQDASRTTLKIAESEGSDPDRQRGRAVRLGESLAGQAFMCRRVEIDGYLEMDEAQPFGSSAAIPLLNGPEAFGVLQLFFAPEDDVSKLDAGLLEAIGTRVAPLILTSISLERTQANALTDITTDLPNERAFYMMLEHQIAETQRKRLERPLTVLAIDIKDFDTINREFGHAAGDLVLNFAAQVIKDNLRQMDFLSRSVGDEFLVVLPTASKQVCHEVIARVHTGFFGRRMRITETTAIAVEVNIGWASFENDGDTPAKLLSFAQLRKEQIKSPGPDKVLFFPQEAAY